MGRVYPEEPPQHEGLEVLTRGQQALTYGLSGEDHWLLDLLVEDSEMLDFIIGFLAEVRSLRHEIRLRAGLSEEMRRIVWDDQAGIVEGDHDFAPRLQERLAEDVTMIGFPWGSLELRNHRHDPADFLALLYQLDPRLEPPSDMPLELPHSLADVTPTFLPEPDRGPGWVS